MKLRAIILFSIFLVVQFSAMAQCAMCTKTAQQLGEKPALGLNNGILYLMGLPLAIIGFIGYKWWKSNNANQ